MTRFLKIKNSLGFRLIFWVGLILLVSISVWTNFNITYQAKKTSDDMVSEVDRLGNTILIGIHRAMLLHSRDDTQQMIQNMGKQKGIDAIRIYNKEGRIKYSNRAREMNQQTNIKAEACHVCHISDPPLDRVDLAGRKRIIHTSGGHRSLAVITPIYNAPGCSAGPCHIHSKDKKVLGALDVAVSLRKADEEILSYKKENILVAVIIFVASTGIIGIFLLRFVNRPIKELIVRTREISRGQYNTGRGIGRGDEIGRLAGAINGLGQEIDRKQKMLNKQRDEYQALFEMTPCYITVQDRDLRLVKFNREFAQNFPAELGEYCFRAYKGRSERCEECPVIRTFGDGASHSSEETGINKDGSRSYWIVRTTPIKNGQGEVVAAMEMCLDVTQLKRLEQEAKQSEEKYRTIFSTIPNPVFVLNTEDLDILDCNNSVTSVYGYHKGEIIGTSFLDLFAGEDRKRYDKEMRSSNVLNQIRHLRKDGNIIYVNIRISASEYTGRNVLLVTTSDITSRLMAEQQLIQASKMATLGEMATGIAHELNQPLSVIKTAGSFLLKKVHKKESIKEDVLRTMAEEIDSHVDRAEKIINHMREFGRKSDVTKEQISVNEPLLRALDIFSQQLKLREIHVDKDLQPGLPPILADRNRLEQVFINLLINARDAIEEKWEGKQHPAGAKRIFIKTWFGEGLIHIEVKDTGTGIPKSILDKIFEPFFTTKKVGKGTGLGLSISYGIVQDYDGIIKVETKASEGSSFIVQFPAAVTG